MKHVYPKRAIFRMLLLLQWERGEMTYRGRLLELLSANSPTTFIIGATYESYRSVG